MLHPRIRAVRGPRTKFGTFGQQGAGALQLSPDHGFQHPDFTLVPAVLERIPIAEPGTALARRRLDPLRGLYQPAFAGPGGKSRIQIGLFGFRPLKLLNNLSASLRCVIGPSKPPGDMRQYVRCPSRASDAFARRLALAASKPILIIAKSGGEFRISRGGTIDRDRLGQAQTYAPNHRSQFSIFKDLIRENSRSLPVTSVASRASAWAAISVSSAPIGVPARSNCVRTSP